MSLLARSCRDHFITVYSSTDGTAATLAAMEFDDDYGRPSKSAQKREAQAKHDLGKKLVDYPKAVLKKLTLDDGLRTAIADAQAIGAHGARRRQLQLIAKLLRTADLTALEEEIARLEMGLPISAPSDKPEKVDPAQPWIDKLAERGDAVIAEMLDEGLAVDRQQLRQLLRNYSKSPQTGSKAHKALGQYIRGLL